MFTIESMEETKTVQSTKIEEDSITKASFHEAHVNKCLTGVRKPVCVRIDSGLYLAFKPVAKGIYGSVCNAIETYMAALILTANNPASICNTKGASINIENIVIERNLRERRKLELKDDTIGNKNTICTVEGCKAEATGTAIWLDREEQHNLCKAHLAEAKNNPKLWRVLNYG